MHSIGIITVSCIRVFHHASTETSESQPACTRPGGVECTSEGNLDVVPGMPNCEPFKSTNGATDSDGSGDGVVEAGSTAANSARASALPLLVLLLLARSRSHALGGRIGVPGNAALASLNFVGSGEEREEGRGKRGEVEPGIRNVIPASRGECQVRTGRSQHTSSSDEDAESP